MIVATSERSQRNRVFGGGASFSSWGFLRRKECSGKATVIRRKSEKTNALGESVFGTESRDDSEHSMKASTLHSGWVTMGSHNRI